MSQNRQIIGIAEFYLLIFISLSFVSSSSSFRSTLSSELVQESKLKEGKGLHAYKIAKGGAGGGHAGSHSSGHTSPHNGGGNGGESRTPTLGGAAVIPAYVAGAAGAANANDRRNRSHQGRSNASLNRIEFPTLLVITFLYTPLLHLCLFV